MAIQSNMTTSTGIPIPEAYLLVERAYYTKELHDVMGSRTVQNEEGVVSEEEFVEQEAMAMINYRVLCFYSRAARDEGLGPVEVYNYAFRADLPGPADIVSACYLDLKARLVDNDPVDVLD